ncbi:MAG: metallophosphoesterase [Betaproteobacteria bacterium]|nr:metallophosphoesterase [Betaproteobacteria bacterium]
MAIIVGDIHGNVEKVLAFLGYKPEEEHVALGDYVDSFYEPQLRQIEALQLLLDSKAVLLWGNHDLHYLRIPPFICTGFQHNWEKSLQEIIEANKHRFLAAYAVDGWLLTHAGCHIRLAQHKPDVVAIADLLNSKMVEYIEKPCEPDSQGIFAIGGGRGGECRVGGIFWHDFMRETGIAPVKQIFGHTETPKPVSTENYIAIDTTNNKTECWLFDTITNELVCLPIERKCPVARINDGASM